ncbi:probable glutathione S-transferase GSTU6 [Phragmites australis]|uniref:probable glutathione S-transferase GSTU6 n=1 Tax=Phragmites australis TaxID=29695 RepID=UPI002D799C87|nr:probable glutathione S-transferase GSTU6 [Phragmites australis]
MDAAGAGAVRKIKVLGAWASPFVLRVRVALHLKGLEYEYVEVDLADKSELLLASNPVHKKVPVLLHGGMPVCESMLIVQYLDEAFSGAGPAFLPADPHDRAVARFWAAYVDNELLSSWLAVYAARTEEKAEAVTRTLAAVDVLEGALADAECSGGKGWFGGDGVGFVDIALGGFVPAIQASEPTTGLRIVDPDRTPRLAAWVERFCALDAARAAMPAVDTLVEMGKKRLAESEAGTTAAEEASK